MYIQEIVEVAIGLIFVYMLMSFATMQARETISGWLKWRPKMLEGAITGMMSDTREGNLRFSFRLLDKYFSPLVKYLKLILVNILAT